MITLLSNDLCNFQIELLSIGCCSDKMKQHPVLTLLLFCLNVNTVLSLSVKYCVSLMQIYLKVLCHPSLHICIDILCWNYLLQRNSQLLNYVTYIRHPALWMNNSPYAGRDRTKKEHLTDRYISIHSPHAGRDTIALSKGTQSVDFNPLSPCGERQAKVLIFNSKLQFQSTLPMRGETKQTYSGLTL